MEGTTLRLLWLGTWPPARGSPGVEMASGRCHGDAGAIALVLSEGQATPPDSLVLDRHNRPFHDVLFERGQHSVEHSVHILDTGRGKTEEDEGRAVASGKGDEGRKIQVLRQNGAVVPPGVGNDRFIRGGRKEDFVHPGDVVTTRTKVLYCARGDVEVRQQPHAVLADFSLASQAPYLAA